MTTFIEGPECTIRFAENELTSPIYTYTLPKGYSINILHITSISNISLINQSAIISDMKLVYPVVNSKSPSTIKLYISNLSKSAELKFTIEKFGQIPDAHYFDKAFDPILVVGDDGKEYNVIPSDQFK